MPTLGAHVSAPGGLWRAVEKGESIGAEVIQFFGASPRSWRVKLPDEEEINRYLETLRKSKIQSAYLHAPYLINIASPDERIRRSSVGALAAHLKITELLWAQGLIFHLGSGKEEISKEEAIYLLVHGMREILHTVPGETKLVMENSAGGGHRIGNTPDDMKSILEKIDSPRIKICFDTAHAYEAGLIEAYTPPLIKKLFDEWDKLVGMEEIAVIHVNDSKTPFNSHNDRHENIGEGHIALDGFKSLAKEKRLKNKPWVLEVPGFDGDGPDRRSMEVLKSCFS